jgi:putative RecB family exonuclease
MMPGVGLLYSHSRLTSFDNCPRAFRYRYVDKVDVDVESIEAFMGKLVHSVVEKLNLVTATGKVPSLPAVLRRYELMWDEGYDESRVRVVRDGTEPDLYRAIGARCTENFYRRHYPFDLDESVGIEEKVMVDLDPKGRYRLRGVIDRLVRTRAGGIEIHDYKTGQRVPSQATVDRDRQLALYQLAVRERFPGEPVTLVWHYLASDRVLTSERSLEQLQALRRETIERIDAAERETEYAPKTGPLCRWCEYNDRCEAGRRHLGLAPVEPETEPPHPAEAPPADAPAPATAARAEPPERVRSDGPAPARVVDREAPRPVTSQLDLFS